MPAPFAQAFVEEFAKLRARFPSTRCINIVHMHHTWTLDHSMYPGHETIVWM